MLRLDGTTLVVGLGKSGLSAVRALAARDASMSVLRTFKGESAPWRHRTFSKK